MQTGSCASSWVNLKEVITESILCEKNKAQFSPHWQLCKQCGDRGK